MEITINGYIGREGLFYNKSSVKPAVFQFPRKPSSLVSVGNVPVITTLKYTRTKIKKPVFQRTEILASFVRLTSKEEIKHPYNS